MKKENALFKEELVSLFLYISPPRKKAITITQAHFALIRIQWQLFYIYTELGRRQVQFVVRWWDDRFSNSSPLKIR
jgi:hypothetical protein